MLFQCGVGGEGSREPDAPVSFCITSASVCAMEMGWDFVVAFDVCDVVGLSVLDVLEVSVGTDMGCFCLKPCISRSFFALAGKASISCNDQSVTSV